MRSVYLQTAMSPSGIASLTLADPGPLGSDGDRVIRYAIEGVPAGVTDLQVLRAFEGAIPMRAVGRNRSDPLCWTYRYADLQPGAVLR